MKKIYLLSVTWLRLKKNRKKWKIYIKEIGETEKGRKEKRSRRCAVSRKINGKVNGGSYDIELIGVCNKRV